MTHRSGISWTYEQMADLMSDMDTTDMANLAMVALDQAGLSVPAQTAVAITIGDAIWRAPNLARPDGMWFAGYGS